MSTALHQRVGVAELRISGAKMEGSSGTRNRTTTYSRECPRDQRVSPLSNPLAFSRIPTAAYKFDLTRGWSQFVMIHRANEKYLEKNKPGEELITAYWLSYQKSATTEIELEEVDLEAWTENASVPKRFLPGTHYSW